MSFLFENLDIYKKAIDFCTKAHRICDAFPDGNYCLSDQLKRASLSVAANIAEGSGRWHNNEKKNFYYFSRGSIFECVAILDICSRNRLLSDEILSEFKNDLTAISKMLTKLIQSLSN